LRKVAAKTKTDFDDLLIGIIEKIGWLFYLILSFAIALQFVKTFALFTQLASKIVVVVLAYYAVQAAVVVVEYGGRVLIEKRQKEEGILDTAVIDLLVRISKVILWAAAIVFVLANLGYNVSAWIAGLGMGGIAAAFASQGILADIFASFSIYFDKPFQVGDFIIVGDDMGTVKDIGLKSTRLQTLQGEELVISNKDLTESRIRNFKKMARRRIIFSFGVTYETSIDKLKDVLALIQEIFAQVEGAELDRVHFKEFDSSSLSFEVVYYVESGDFYQYMDVQQQINFAIKHKFDQKGIEMAYPTQTIFLHETKKINS
jgi:small-conductance mechanosensitive channel